MNYGICLWSSVAVRAHHSHASEMITQLLFGETYSVTDQCEEWIAICTSDCHYAGWISCKQHQELSSEEYAQYQELDKYRVNDVFLFIRDAITHIGFPLFLGAQFPMPVQGTFTIANRTFKVELPERNELPHHDGLTAQQEQLLDTAFRFLNAPYLWGGRTITGIDCSGFVQSVFRSIGIQLPRDASQQVDLGEVVNFAEEAQIGDLCFFENTEGKIVHTGLVCGYQQIIHSSGHVQINTLDNTGIYNHELKRYTHQLRVIKRVL